MRLVLILFTSLLWGCTSIDYVEECDVYTYSHSYGHSLSGLIYLDENLEKNLRGLLPSKDSEKSACWYTSNGSIEAKIAYNSLEGMSYIFEVKDESWVLKESLQTIEIPAHK